jgi:hypothetical protein
MRACQHSRGSSKSALGASLRGNSPMPMRLVVRKHEGGSMAGGQEGRAVKNMHGGRRQPGNSRGSGRGTRRAIARSTRGAIARTVRH